MRIFEDFEIEFTVDVDPQFVAFLTGDDAEYERLEQQRLAREWHDLKTPR